MKHLKKIIVVLSIYLILIAFFIFSPDAIMNADESLFLWINSLYSNFANYYFFAITFMGSSIFWLALIILFWFGGKKDASIRLLYVFILDSIFLLFLKYGFVRPRPTQDFQNFLIDYDLGPSFPSGHTQRAFSGMMVLGSYFGKISAWLFLLSCLVGLSRIYLGFHYPLDVLIGLMNGIITGYAVMFWPTKYIKKAVKNFYKTIRKLIRR